MSQVLKRNIIDLLRSTKRNGIDDLINYMDTNGFFAAPCSGQYHLCKEGGLAEHSFNVYMIGWDIVGITNVENDHKGIKGKNITVNTWAIVSLLHDLGKIGQYGKPNYVPNMVQDKKNKGELIQSETKPFTTNTDLLPVPHEIRSIHIASQFIELTEEEAFAILHHNGMYGDLKYQLQGKERPLQMLLHFADMWASRVVEK